MGDNHVEDEYPVCVLEWVNWLLSATWCAVVITFVTCWRTTVEHERHEVVRPRQSHALLIESLPNDTGESTRVRSPPGRDSRTRAPSVAAWAGAARPTSGVERRDPERSDGLPVEEVAECILRSNRAPQLVHARKQRQATESACELCIRNNTLGGTAIYRDETEHEVAQPTVRDADADMKPSDGFRCPEPQSHLEMRSGSERELLLAHRRRTRSSPVGGQPIAAADAPA
jgi:hypothetical protein